jgi:hypothetical protein
VSLPTNPGDNDPTPPTTQPPPFIEQPSSQPDATPWAPEGFDDFMQPEPVEPTFPVVGSVDDVAGPPAAGGVEKPARLRPSREGRIKYGGQKEAALPGVPMPPAEWPRSSTSSDVTGRLPGIIGSLPDSLATGPDGEVAAGLAFEKGLYPNRRGPVVASGILAALGWIIHAFLLWRRRPRWDPA